MFGFCFDDDDEAAVLYGKIQERMSRPYSQSLYSLSRTD